MLSAFSCFKSTYFSKKQFLGRGGGQVVSVLAFYSETSTLNPAEAYNLCLNINKIEARDGPFIVAKKQFYSKKPRALRT